jgi:polyvinyl alcohol dehydrogenase (cytochrome)
MPPRDPGRSLARATCVAAAVAAALALGLAASAATAVAAEAPPPVPAETSPVRILCAAPESPVALGSAQWNGWGRGPDNTRYQPEPAIRATDVPKLALKWAFGYPSGPAADAPTLVDGRLFVASAAGRVYSLDAKTGCTYWSYDAAAGVHTAISIAELAARRMPAAPRKSRKDKHKLTNAHLEVVKAPSAAFFGDDKGAVYALNAVTGALLWKTQVDGHPLARIEGSPTVYLNHLYVAVGSSELESARDPAYPCCTFRGSVAALDITNGSVEWKTYLVGEEPQAVHGETGGVLRFAPSGVPAIAPPTVDAARSLLYVSTGDSYEGAAQPLADAVVALDLADGKMRWAKPLEAPQPDRLRIDTPPVLRTLSSGREMLLVGQRSGWVYSLDPERAGEVLWRLQAAGKETSGAPGAIARGAAADHRSLYVAISGLDAEPANASGSLTAIDIKSGSRRWQTTSPTPACSWGDPPSCAHAQVQAVTVIPGAAFSGSMDGHLRAYSTIDGKILWDYDTAKDFRTVNSVRAAGGSLQRGGATIVNGVVYVNSGAESHGQPGNVLLAFSVDGK